MLPTERTEVPGAFDVAVLMESRPGVTRWQPLTWKVVGLLAGDVATGPQGRPESMPADGERERLLWRGYSVRLHVDEAESYYHNLMAPVPQGYVVMRGEVGEQPVPALVTLSYDEANAYAEGDEAVDTVPLPPELVLWVEAYVLEHYVPEKKTRRKRRNWSEEGTA